MLVLQSWRIVTFVNCFVTTGEQLIIGRQHDREEDQYFCPRVGRATPQTTQKTINSNIWLLDIV